MAVYKWFAAINCFEGDNGNLKSLRFSEITAGSISAHLSLFTPQNQKEEKSVYKQKQLLLSQIDAREVADESLSHEGCQSWEMTSAHFDL
jgi:hypothetical protein